MEKTCCFIGHSNTSERIYPLLVNAVEKLVVDFGVTDFRAGNYGAFDRMAVRAINEVKGKFPNITVYIMLPYLPSPDYDPHLPKCIDGAIYPEGMETVPHKVAIPRLNRIMVDESAYAIACVRFSAGGAATTYKYALNREKKGKMKVINIWQAEI